MNVSLCSDRRGSVVSSTAVALHGDGGERHMRGAPRNQ